MVPTLSTEGTLLPQETLQPLLLLPLLCAHLAPERGTIPLPVVQGPGASGWRRTRGAILWLNIFPFEGPYCSVGGHSLATGV